MSEPETGTSEQRMLQPGPEPVGGREAPVSSPLDVLAEPPGDPLRGGEGKSPKLRREIRFRRSLGLADAASLSLALVATAYLFAQDRLTAGVVVMPIAFVAIAKAMGLYDRDEHLLHKTTLDEVPKLFALATTTILALVLSGSAIVGGGWGQAQVLGGWLLLLLLMVSFRSMARGFARRTSDVERCLYVGESGAAEDLREKLRSTRSVRAELVGWLPFEPADFGPSLAGALPLVERVRAVVAERDVERVILGPGVGGHEELLDAVRRIKDHGLEVSVLPDVTRVVSSSVALDRLNGITLLGLRHFEITRSSRIIKRAFDVCGALLGLTLSAPVLMVTAIAIKLDTPGPVLFRQRRAGRDGKPFYMLKLRSMVDGAEAQLPELRELNEADGLFKMAADPRITRVGRVIRKLYIDEIPQLVNVLRGEMSLVGPRPLPLEEDRQIVGSHRRRLDIAPGITGPWQVLGSSRIPLRDMVQLDYQYVAEWSVWNDIRILLLTVGQVFRGHGL